MAYIFEWDPRKATANVRKHRVGFWEACTVFGDNRAIRIPDLTHSSVESRYLLLGRSRRTRMLVVSYTERGPATRIISARLASRRERTTYAQDNPAPDKA